MLSFFRRFINSKVGLVVTFAVLAVIALAFAAGDVTGLGHGSSGLTGDSVATVGKVKISSAELRERVQNELEAARQQQPTLDINQFIAAGGLDGTLDRVINGIALEQFAATQGMVVSKQAVDGQIASIPALQGPDGKFSQQSYERLLATRKLTDAQVRADIARETIAQHLILPNVGASQVPAQVALPYASLLLERRQGQLAFIPARALGAGAAPTEAEIAAFYKNSGTRYVVPERRIARYALVAADQVKAAATPSDAEIVQAYQSERAKFAPTEKRTLAQVIVGDQAAATALANKVKGGAAIAEAARAIGLEAATVPAIDKAGYATAQGSPDLANAVFSAAKGTVVGPVRTPLGFAIVKIETVEQIAGKSSLEQARGQLVTELTTAKTAAAIGKIHDALDDAISNKSTFDELVADQKLVAKATPPLLADGRNPDDPAAKADPVLTPILTAAFAAEQGDSPQLVQLGQDGSFAVVALDRIVGAAQRPLAQIKPIVARDFQLDRAARAARKVAVGIVAGVNKGQPLASLLAATSLKLPPVQKMDASRAQLAADQRGAPPPLVLMFSMGEKTAKLLEAPRGEGWLIVSLDKIDPGNAADKPGVVAAARADLGKVIGREYVAQFGEAVRRLVGVKKNAAAIAKVRESLTGQGAGQP